MRDKGSDAGPARPRAGLAVAVVAAVIALVTAGWPLASAAFPDRQPLAGGTVLVIGPDPAHSAQVTVGQGWALLKAESDQEQADFLRLGAVELTVSYVSLLSRGQARYLWAGLRRVIQEEHPGARLGAPQPITIARTEAEEEAGSLAEAGLAGRAEVLADPAQDFAIELTVLAPRGAEAGLRVAARVAGSLRIAPAP